ncbi:MAG: ATP-binding protein [Aquabacterium sp.]|nr:ATP-binding protein [Aquabacterium sp.]
MPTSTLKRLLWPQRLHSQLVLMVSMSLLLALGLLGGYTASEQSSIALRGFESQAASLARSVAISSSNLILTESLDQVETLVLRSADFDEVLSLRVMDPDGGTLSHVARLRGQAPKLIFDLPKQRPQAPKDGLAHLTSDVANGVVTVWHPIKADKLIGWVRLDYNTLALQDLRARIWRNTLVVAVLTISLCAGLMAWLLRRPLSALIKAKEFAIELVNAGGRQIPFTPAPIEVIELNTALNQTSQLLLQQSLLIQDGLRQHRVHEAQLADQNKQLSAIFAMSRDGLVTFDDAGLIQFANPAFVTLTGLLPDQVIGQTQTSLDAHLRERAKAGSNFTGLDACFAHTDNAAAAEHTLLLPGSQAGVLTLRGQHSASNRFSRILYVCDVTKQHTLDHMKSEFLAMAAHELRTPMVSIFGFTELMIKRELSAEQRADMLGSIYRQSKSMIAILNELLDLARIEARRGQDFKLELVDLADVVQSVVADFKPPLGRDTPLVDASIVPMPVHVDTHKLQQAVLNVLSNAYKYSPDGGPVTVRYFVADAEQARYRFGVEIQDQGIGLSPEHLARLGERFFRADKSGNIPGTGLGVTIVKELIELMGGHMQVDSTLGKGTTVTLWL